MRSNLDKIDENVTAKISRLHGRRDDQACSMYVAGLKDAVKVSAISSQQGLPGQALKLPFATGGQPEMSLDSYAGPIEIPGFHPPGF